MYQDEFPSFLYHLNTKYQIVKIYTLIILFLSMIIILIVQRRVIVNTVHISLVDYISKVLPLLPIGGRTIIAIEDGKTTAKTADVSSSSSAEVVLPKPGNPA